VVACNALDWSTYSDWSTCAPITAAGITAVAVISTKSVLLIRSRRVTDSPPTPVVNKNLVRFDEEIPGMPYLRQ